jgi:mRNA-degrading endonuclease HigB of HigAB toxin-antitoxin module
MNLYTQIYEFSASVGALEGFVYKRPDVQAVTIQKWVENLEKAYWLLPEDVLKEIQPPLDGTLGRAVKSVSQVLGEKHVLVAKLKAMVKGPLPSSPDDFQKRKWFEKKV